MVKVEIKLVSDDFEIERTGKEKTYEDDELDFDMLREVINQLVYLKNYYQKLFNNNY